jgi:hypothetical protein
MITIEKLVLERLQVSAARHYQQHSHGLLFAYACVSMCPCLSLADKGCAE